MPSFQRNRCIFLYNRCAMLCLNDIDTSRSETAGTMEIVSTTEERREEKKNPKICRELTLNQRKSGILSYILMFP